MLKKIIGIYKVKARIHGWAARMRLLFKKHGGKIAYYGCVALVLAGIAIAAEQYRNDVSEPDMLILPPAEVEISAEVEQDPLFTIPENLTLLRPYSQLPLWNEELELWENHTAVDYRCAEDQVLSFSDGIVQTIGTSGLYGGFVEIETKEYLLRYASIDPADDLAPGDSISAGEVLGVASEGMPGEGQLGRHLHLEVERMGERVDFVEQVTSTTH